MNSKEDPYHIFFDKNDLEWTSQRTYIDNLENEVISNDMAQKTTQISESDVIHLNYLNPFGRLLHGKENRFRHFSELTRSISSNTAIVATEHGGAQFHPRETGVYITSDVLSNVSDFITRKGNIFVASQSDAVIAISSIVKTNLVDAGIQEKKIHVVEHGVSEDFQNYAETADEKFVLHVSKYSPHKNPEAIVTVAEELDTRIVIVGDGWENHVGNQLSSVENVDLLGYISKDRLIDLYNRAAAFYFPSKFESFGLPILEAAVCGTVPVVSKYSAAPDVCGGHGFLVEPDATDQHLSIIHDILEDDELRENKEDCICEFAQRFTWERTAKMTMKVYESVV